MFGQLNSLRVDCRDRSVSAQAHPQNLRQAVHGICSIHPGTGTTGGAGLLFKFPQLFIAHGACRMGTHCLKHGGKASLLSFHVSCQHGAARHEHGRHIDPRCRHQKTRHILIAVRNHHQSIKLVGQCHTFRRIRDQIPRYQ